MKSRASLTCFRACLLPGRVKDLPATRYSDWATGRTIQSSNLGGKKRFLSSPKLLDGLRVVKLATELSLMPRFCLKCAVLLLPLNAFVAWTGRTFLLPLPVDLHLNEWSDVSHFGAPCGAVGWGTALKATRSRVRFRMASLDFFYWHNPSGRTMTRGSAQPLKEMSARNLSWRVNAVCRADNLGTFICRLCWNSRASSFWNLQGLFRPVMGLLHLY